ncbi:MAG TPA: diacylglycerol kinase family protein [Verrucomicrobiae bacterium]|nr:diacylglycerol kinase family protein [Verrucomicrobiae bacterium]
MPRSQPNRAQPALLRSSVDASAGPATAVVVNPARTVDVGGLRALVLAILSEAGWPEPLWLETTPSDPGGGQARAAVEAGASVVFVSGGDGTVGRVAAVLADTESALAVLPAGTGNLLARNLGLPRDTAAAVRLGTRGGRRRIDIGEADGRVFTVAAGIGFDAQVLALTSPRAKRWLGWPAYVLAGIAHLHEPRFAVSVTLDGSPTIVRQVRSVLVANVGRFPGGLDLVPGASPDDGQLDVALIAPRGVAEWLWLVNGLARRRPRAPSVVLLRAREVVVISDRPQPREVDGDPVEPGSRLTVSIRARALTVCVPARGPGGPGRPRDSSHASRAEPR